MAPLKSESKPFEKAEWDLPALREIYQIPELAQKAAVGQGGDLWGVKFYPYNEPGVDPIFAVVGNEHILICRPLPAGAEGKYIEFISSIVDEDPEANNYVCAWAKNLENGTPLLCFGGGGSQAGSIKIINALTGKLQQTLIGHGGEIEDLQVSPINPQILASASEDTTVRIWSLDPAHAKQPCVAILAGDGHRETILSLSFHQNGRYILSSGIDHLINLWVIPEFPDSNTGTNKPTQIYYPHFSTSEIHAFIVDSVSFHGDLVLSKGDNDNYIALFAINGFSSTNPPPSSLSAPTTSHDSSPDTRSAFTTPPSPPYTRLLHFNIAESPYMFTRFSLFPSPTHPIIAFCAGTSKGGSKLLFWDLSRLEKYYEYIASIKSQTQNQNQVTAQPQSPNHGRSESAAAEQAQPIKRPAWLIPSRSSRPPGFTALSRVRESSPTESTFSSMTTAESWAGERPLNEKDLEMSKERWSKKYDMTDPWRAIAPHKEEVVKGIEFIGRQCAWSVGGEWCVVVGSAGVMAIFERWNGEVPALGNQEA